MRQLSASLSQVRTLVTGATGFVGSHLVRRLVREGAHVTVFRRPGARVETLADVIGSIDQAPGDITRLAPLQRAVSRCNPQIVFHLAGDASGRGAADDPRAWARSREVNLGGTANLLQALRDAGSGEGRVIRTGSMEEYGHGDVPFVETQREQAVSPYSAGVIAATQLAHAVAPRWGLSVVTVRPSVIYGPGQSTRFFLPGLIASCVAGREFAMTSGEQSVDFVYVQDVVECLIRAAVARDVGGEILNAGSGVATTVRSLAETVVQKAGAKPQLLRIGARPHRAGESGRRVLDCGKARNLLGWQAQTPLEQGLEQTIHWFRRQIG